MRHRLGFLVGVVVAATATPARANPFDIYGADPEAMAMAGAYSTLAVGASGAYYNPGALGLSLRDEFLLGAMGQTQELELNGREVPIDQTSGTALGFGSAFEVFDHRFAFGSLFFIPSDRIVRVASIDPRKPRYLFYDNYPNRLALYFALGTEIVPGVLSIGGGAQILAHIGGDILVRFNLLPQGMEDDYGGENPCGGAPGCTLAPGDVPQSAYSFATFDESLDFSIFPNVGLLFQPMDRLRLAFAYREGFQLQLRIPERAHIQLFGQDIELETFNTMDDFYQPDTAVAGVSWSPDFRPEAETWAAALDVTHQRYSQFRVNELDLQISDIAEGTGLPLAILQRKVVDPDFNDVFSLRMGWRHRINPTWRYLAGYAFLPSPVPEQTGFSNFLDSDKHVFTTGAGANLGFASEAMADMEVTLAGQLFWFSERSFSKGRPADYLGREIGFREGVEIPGPEDLVVIAPGRKDSSMEGWLGSVVVGFRYRFD